MVDGLSANDRTKISGWGRATFGYSTIRRAQSASEVNRIYAESKPRGVIPRGLGRSYGDAAQNSGGVTLRFGNGHRWDLKRHGTAATVLANGGDTIAELLEYLIPQGFIIPVLPGTAFVTVGGAIAADVHGKNHHRDGSFADCVEQIHLIAPSGELLIQPGTDVFRATVGGMGMTGVIAAATLRLKPIETSAVLVDTDRAHDLDALMSMMATRDENYEYSVAWVDLMPKSRGRGVLTRANPAPRSAVISGDPLAYEPVTFASLPDYTPSWALQPTTVRLFNSAWYHRAPASEQARLMSIPAFFHPLDAIGNWNRIYGKRGFIQYQFVIPFGCEETLRSIVKLIQLNNLAVYLVVLKRMGPANNCYLSFPMPGWTLALDFPLGQPSLGGVLDRCNELVGEAGGHIYLAKDACAKGQAIEQMYPLLDTWRSVRAGLDPDGVLVSDLTRRLALI